MTRHFCGFIYNLWARLNDEMETDGKREREDDSIAEDKSKRSKSETDLRFPGITAVVPSLPQDEIALDPQDQLIRPAYHDHPVPVSRLGLKPILPDLPPSLELVTGVKTDLRARKGFVGQEEVGIIGYAGPSELKGLKGVIKQR